MEERQSIREPLTAHLRGAIAKAGKPQYQVARDAGISRTAMYDKMHGRSPFTWDELTSIAASLGVSVIDLIPENAA